MYSFVIRKKLEEKVKGSNDREGEETPITLRIIGFYGVHEMMR
jgi:hypothetical protein